MAERHRIIVVREGDEQAFEGEALPVSIGSSDTDDVRVAMGPAAGAVASIGFLEGQAFIQSARSSAEVLISGDRLVDSSWLRDGDVIQVGAASIACTFRGGALRLEVGPTEAGTPLPAGTAEPPRVLRAEPIAPTPFEPSGAKSVSGVGRRARPALVAVWFVGAVLLLLLWFSFTAVSVRLAIEPVPDETELPSTWLQFRIGDRFLLRPGSHEVVAGKEGYHTLEEKVEVTADSDQRFDFVLRKLPGLVDVVTLPVDGAVISVDGEPVGTTPANDLEIEAGPHTLTLKAPRHLPTTLPIVVEGAGKQQRVEVELVPAWAPVTLDSVPAAAAVLVDGMELGETPGTFELDAGMRTIELQLEGHKPWRQKIEVVADESQELEAIVLEKLDGRLHLETGPPGAQVIVGEASLGHTPLDLSLASEKLHEISLFKRGYELAVRSIELAPGEEQTVHVELRARMGAIDLVTRPSGATLSIDGRPAGEATQKLRLLSVPHTLVVRKEGYKDKRVTVTPRPDFPQRIEVELEKPGQPRRADPARLETSLGQALLLVGPGTFRMGSRRGEPGRRSNEAERPVQLTRAFFITAKEVTNREFRRFAPDHAPATYAGFDLAGDEQPVTWVSWGDAARFCNWLSRKESLPPAYLDRNGQIDLATPMGTGYRLPTEAEWAWAARFAGGASSQRFPWGDRSDPPAGSGNYADASAAGIVSSALLSYRDGFPVSAPVGANGANKLGLFDVGGNVAEWVHDRYRIYPESPGRAPSKDPFGPETGGLRVIRGSSWKHASPVHLRLAYRDYGKEGREDVGFRIARYAK